MNPTERRLIGHVAAAHALTHIIELTYAVLLTRIQDDFGTRDVVMGAIATIFGWTFGSSAIPAGFLTDRLGSRRVLIYAFCGSTVMAVLVGLAPNAWLLAAALAGLGLSIGLYHPAGLSAMAQGVRQRGMALGLHGVAGNLGQALAPAIAVGLAIAVDWRLGFFCMAGLSALLAIFLSRAHLPVHGDSEVLSAEDIAEPPAEHEGRAHNLLKPLLLTYAAFVLSGIVYRGAITYLPKHLEEGVSEDFGAAFVTVALVMGAVGQLVGGWVSQRVRLERMAPVSSSMAVPALILTAVLGGPALVVVAAAFVFFYFASQPVFTGLIADYTPPGAVGRSYGVSFFAGFGLGSTGGVIAGALVDTWDTEAAYLGLTVFMALVVGLSVLLWTLAETRHRDLAPTAAVETAT
ncbi:MAG TPA: MFS transporter [Dehalococcoidia bacterium]|jgi:predicted MFS family arabinose efflux permease|nr:MFS transporter [Dehalococcoidia bacterium]